MVACAQWLTFQQISQPALRARCCGSVASPPSAGASAPSDAWRWRPANHAPPTGRSPTGCRWAHLRCPPDACGTGDRWQEVRLTRFKSCRGNSALFRKISLYKEKKYYLKRFWVIRKVLYKSKVLWLLLYELYTVWAQYTEQLYFLICLYVFVCNTQWIKYNMGSLSSHVWLQYVHPFPVGLYVCTLRTICIYLCLF